MGEVCVGDRRGGGEEVGGEAGVEEVSWITELDLFVRG